MYTYVYILKLMYTFKKATKTLARMWEAYMPSVVPGVVLRAFQRRLRGR